MARANRVRGCPAEVVDVLRNWRAWVLLVLLVGPVLVYMGLGALWLFQHRWLLIAGSIWVGCGVVFSVLASRWTPLEPGGPAADRLGRPRHLLADRPRRLGDRRERGRAGRVRVARPADRRRHLHRDRTDARTGWLRTTTRSPTTRSSQSRWSTS